MRDPATRPALPPLAAVAAARAPVPAAVVAVTVGERDCVARVVTHPALAAALTHAGGHETPTRRWQGPAAALRDAATRVGVDVLTAPADSLDGSVRTRQRTWKSLGGSRRGAMVGTRTFTVVGYGRFSGAQAAPVAAGTECRIARDDLGGAVAAWRASGWVVAAVDPAAGADTARARLEVTPVAGAPGLAVVTHPGGCDCDTDDPTVDCRHDAVATVAVRTPLDAMADIAAWDTSRRWAPVALDAAAADAIDVALAAPTGLGAGAVELWPHQAGIAGRAATTRRGLAVCAGTGTGKTRAVAAGLTARLRHAGAGAGAVVICPPAVAGHWADELGAVGCPAPVLVATGARSLAPAPRGHGRVVVCSASLARTNAAALAGAAGILDAVVVDEATWLAGNGATVGAAWDLRGAASAGFALSATPGDDGRLEALAAWALGDRELFAARGVTAPAAERLGVYLAAGGDGPDRGRPLRTHIDARDGDLAGHVAAELTDAIGAWVAPSAGRAGRFAARAELLRAWSAAKAALWDPRDGSARHRHVLDVVAACLADGDAVIVFADTVALAAAITTAGHDAGWRIGHLDSASSAQRRHATVADFDAGRLDVVVAGAAAAHGVNLGRADVVVHADVPASVADAHQRTSRAIRGAQRRGEPLDVVWCAWAGTFEHDLVTRLSALTEQAGAGGDASGPGDVFALLAAVLG